MEGLINMKSGSPSKKTHKKPDMSICSRDFNTNNRAQDIVFSTDSGTKQKRHVSPIYLFGKG
jgi:hypothetical protein